MMLCKTMRGTINIFKIPFEKFEVFFINIIMKYIGQDPAYPSGLG
jgi:hypothetical protein